MSNEGTVAMEVDDEDLAPAQPEDDYTADSQLGTGCSPTANIIASAGLSLLPDKNLSFLSDELNKRQRCNAKAVEWLSMESEHLGQFRSVRSFTDLLAQLNQEINFDNVFEFLRVLRQRKR
jgi:hypothetical protein